MLSTEPLAARLFVNADNKWSRLLEAVTAITVIAITGNQQAASSGNTGQRSWVDAIAHSCCGTLPGCVHTQGYSLLIIWCKTKGCATDCLASHSPNQQIVSNKLYFYFMLETRASACGGEVVPCAH